MRAICYPAVALSLAAALAAPGFALDPAMFQLVSPDARVLAGADMARIQVSPLGQMLWNQLSANAAQLDAIASQTGFDPRRDLREVLVASGDSADPKASLLLIRGTFDTAKMIAAGVSAGATSSTYRGVTLLAHPKGSGQEAAAFVLGYLAAGPRAQVQAAIDRAQRVGNPTALAVRAQLASTRFDAWMVSSAPSALSGAIPGATTGPMNAMNALQNVDSIVAGARFGSLIEISAEAETKTSQDANALADVLRLFSSLVQTQGNANTPSELAGLWKSVTIGAQGNLVSVSASIPQSDIERLSNPTPARNRSRRAPRQVI